MFIIILWHNCTNKFFIFRDLLNFTKKCIGGQIKAFSFLFYTASDAKSTKGGECYNTKWLQNNKQKGGRLILCIYMQWKSMKRWRALIQRMNTKQWVKNKHIKRKQICPVCFGKVIKFQENKFEIIQIISRN